MHQKITDGLLYALSPAAGTVTLPNDYMCEFMIHEGYDSDRFCLPPPAAESLRTWNLPSVPETTPTGVHATRHAAFTDDRVKRQRR